MVPSTGGGGGGIDPLKPRDEEELSKLGFRSTESEAFSNIIAVPSTGGGGGVTPLILLADGGLPKLGGTFTGSSEGGGVEPLKPLEGALLVLVTDELVKSAVY